jgi:mannose-6-phosphate isomerase-like protein (cupin superfamily)
MAQWSTAILPTSATRTAPSGNVEIRILPHFESGEITHAFVGSRSTSRPAFMEKITEFFYVLDGEGELWRRSGKEEEIVRLNPRRCVSMPAGVHYQFRCVNPPMILLVVVAPRWDMNQWHEVPEGFWESGGKEIRRKPLVGPITSWQRQDLPMLPDYLAPDGSEIRLLLDCQSGGVSHCTLPPGATSSAVRHKTVEEVWYVLRGEGEIWRGQNRDEEGKACALHFPSVFHFSFGPLGPLLLRS